MSSRQKKIVARFAVKRAALMAAFEAAPGRWSALIVQPQDPAACPPHTAPPTGCVTAAWGQLAKPRGLLPGGRFGSCARNPSCGRWLKRVCGPRRPPIQLVKPFRSWQTNLQLNEKNLADVWWRDAESALFRFICPKLFDLLCPIAPFFGDPIVAKKVAARSTSTTVA